MFGYFLTSLKMEYFKFSLFYISEQIRVEQVIAEKENGQKINIYPLQFYQWLAIYNDNICHF